MASSSNGPVSDSWKQRVFRNMIQSKLNFLKSKNVRHTVCATYHLLGWCASKDFNLSLSLVWSAKRWNRIQNFRSFLSALMAAELIWLTRGLIRAKFGLPIWDMIWDMIRSRTCWTSRRVMHKCICFCMKNSHVDGTISPMSLTQINWSKSLGS